MSAETLDPNLYYRITDLPDAKPITGAEVVEAVQEGQNVKFTLAQLLVAGKSAYAVAVENGYMGTEPQWLSSLIGVAGRSAFEIAVANGFVGTQTQWLTSMKGANGKSALEVLQTAFPDQVTDAASMAVFLKGERGQIGTSTHIVGTLGASVDLPNAAEAEANGESYLINKRLYVAVDSSWVDMGDLSGPPGLGLTIKGSLSTVGGLPVANNLQGDCYIISKTMWVWDGLRWSEVSQVGPAGSSAYQLAVSQGYRDTLVQWLASLQGARGIQGPKGDQGDKGENSGAIHLKGELASPNQLPVDAVVGDGYVVNGNIFARTETEWKDLGRFNGASAYELALANGFVGTEAQWLAALKAPALELAGAVATPEELPAAPADGTSLIYVVGTKLYVGRAGVWTASGSVIGSDGKSAYQISQDHGFNGDELQWLASLHGPAGRDGTDGIQGLEGKSAYETAVANGFVGTQEQWLVSLQNGPAGKSAYDIAVENGFVGTQAEWLAFLKGAKGDQGNQGLQGLKGDQGNQGLAGPSLRFRGVFLNVGALAAAPAPAGGDFATVGRFHYYYNPGDGWLQGTEVAGTDGTNGKSAYEIAVESGFIGSQAEWLATLGGVDGKSAFEIAQEVNPALADESAWLASLMGPRGAVGPMGPGIAILGTLASPANLPAVGAHAGDGYLIANHFWGWDGASWVDCGVIQGPAGPKGDVGLQGIKGNKGDRGDRGSSLILLDRNPGVLDGAINDVAVNSGTQEVFLKSDVATWTSMGFFGGGNVYSPNADGKLYLRSGEDWIAFDSGYPTTTDDNARVYKNGAWVPLDVAADGKLYLRKDGAWVQFDVAADGKTYVRKDGQWVQFNHYDLNAVGTTGACDLATSNVFKIDNTAALAKTVTLTNPPAARATTVVILITGNAGAITWPANGSITWADNAAPTLGAALTNVVLFWDGTRYVGSVGASA